MTKKDKNNKQAWNSFRNYWNRTSWKDLDVAQIKEILDESDAKIKVPKEVTRKNGGQFFREVRKALVPARTSNFGGVKVSFKGTAGEKIFGSNPISYAEVTKLTHAFIRDNNLKVGGKAKTEKAEVLEEDEDEEE